MFHEQPVSFNADGTRLAGMLHVPASRGQLQGVGLVMIPGGLTRRVGLHRLFVTAARAFAALGAWALRFDLPGVGESEGQVRWFTSARLASLDACYVPEAQAALDCLETHAALRVRLLLGHCNGARSAVATAAADPRVHGTLAWGMPTGTDDGLGLAPWLGESLATLLGRRIPALFVYGRKDAVWPHFEAFATGASRESRERIREYWTVQAITSANHDFTAGHWTREVINISAQWIRDQWSGKQDAPIRMTASTPFDAQSPPREK